MKRKVLPLILALTLSLGLLPMAALAAPRTDLGWVAAYQEKVKALAREEPGLTYALIYVDEDQIPELVADQNGYYVYLFTYAQGQIQTLMDGWGYGAMGNTGYEYLPYGNSIFNHNSDFAGALSYETYMRIGPSGELVERYDEPLTVWYFEDWNGNDFPDDGEYLDTPRYRYGDRVLSEEEYDSYGAPGEYQFIEGSMSKDEILETLRAYTPQPEAPAAAPGAKLPGYYGDQAKCRMTAEQAKAYANVISNRNAQIESDVLSIDYLDLSEGQVISRAALIDAGNGVPLLFWAGGFNYDLMGDPDYVGEYLDFGVWQLDGNTARKLNIHCEILFYSDRVLLDFGGGDYSGYQVHMYENGGISDAVSSTAIIDYSGEYGPEYSVDGNPSTEGGVDAWKANWFPEEPFCGFEYGGGVEGWITGGVDAAALAAALNAYQGPSAPAMAVASTQTVSVDGKAVEFQMYALKNEAGNLTNYVKVRDLAYVLSGTAAQFEVGYHGMVNIAPGWAYTPNGSEMKTPFSGDRAYTKSASQTNVGGELMDLDAIVLTDDAGGGYTYYQLRDLGKALGFNVGWSGDRGVFIETDRAYDPNN